MRQFPLCIFAGKNSKEPFLFGTLYFTVEDYLESGTAYSALPDLKKSLPIMANAALTLGCSAGEGKSLKRIENCSTAAAQLPLGSFG